MERRLCEAAIEGSVESLNEIVAEDGLILDRIVAGCFEGGSSSNPLHTAASYGHTEFVKELLRLNPDLSEVLDSRHRTALHLATSKGHLQIVRELIKAGPDTCLARDRDGRNPLHVAAVKGQVEVLEELARANPNAARARVDGGETILHQCVNHNQLKTLEALLKMEMIRGQEFVNAKDIDGNTILHLAVSNKQFEIAKHVLKDSKIDVNSTNTNKQTAMDILFLTQNSRKDNRDDQEEDPKELNIEDFLREAKARRGKDLVQSDWLTKKRDTLMVVASLIATMAFQASVNPPEGVWQQNSSEYRAGEAVMAYNYPDSYPYFLRFNTIGFVASLSTILLLISELPFRKRAYMFVLVVIMWLTITSMAVTYAYSIVVVTPKKDRKSLSHTIVVAVIVWCSVMGLLLLLHAVRLGAKLVEERRSRNKAIDRIFKFNSIRSLKVQPKAWISLVHGGRSCV